MEWWKRLPETVRDAIGAVPLVVVYVVGQDPFSASGSPVGAVAVVLAIVGGTTVRRRWPVVTWALSLAVVLGATTGLEFLVVAGYSVVVYAERSRPVVVAVVSTVVTFLGYLRYWPVFDLDVVAGDLFLILAVSVLPVVLARAVRQARHSAAELVERNLELERLREQEAAHAVQTERLRIARELHDVVAHHVSAMTVRARAGLHVAAQDPQAATDALAFVAESGTSTLAAMGTFVGALRGSEPGDGPVPRTPQPGLDDLPALLESFRGVGLVVHEDVALPDTLPQALSLNAYRIVQEALTNVVRHAAAERAWLRVAVDGGRLAVEVDDDGRGLPPDHRPGHGLVGMAERAALHGGTVTVGASPRGGCRVAVTLELERLADPGSRDVPGPRASDTPESRGSDPGPTGDDPPGPRGSDTPGLPVDDTPGARGSDSPGSRADGARAVQP
jgi:signal transduction histidine kinase